ncbi:MAG: hypothetical protein IPI58_02265 [Alphaproteobacteria bacterium]|nr:MAG: hypothetical protein IPI58_02265 [Alphaproteobacteria bacterium]
MTTLHAQITPALIWELARKTKRLEMTSDRLKILRRKAFDPSVASPDKPQSDNPRHAKLLGEIEIAEEQERRLLNRIRKIEDIHTLAQKNRRRKPEVSLSPSRFENPKRKPKDPRLLILFLLLFMLNWSAIDKRQMEAKKMQRERQAKTRISRQMALSMPGSGRSGHQTA